MKLAHLICLTLILASAAALAQFRSIPHGNQPNGIPFAEEPPAVPANFLETSQGTPLAERRPAQSKRRSARSQTQTEAEQVLYTFQGGSDGYYPNGNLIFDSSGNLYGVTQFGGGVTCTAQEGYTGCGTVFELKPNGSGGWAETILHSFQGGSDGAQPTVGLTLDQAGNLYGTTEEGGSTGEGTVFELSPKPGGGWTETILYNFGTNGGASDGAYPQGLIFDASGNLYGTTAFGGNGYCDHDQVQYCGTVFELSPSGSGGWTETILYRFPSGDSGGYEPSPGLIFDPSGNLYGTTIVGGVGYCPGSGGCGTVFELSPNGSGGWREATIYDFSGGDDGWGPVAGMIVGQSGNLYGTASQGGEAGGGIVFEFSPNGSGGWTETVLNDFPGGSDGSAPVSPLVFDQSGNLYSTTLGGGNTGCLISCGTVFELSPNGNGGWAETVLYGFRGGSDGNYPSAGVIFDQTGHLYGTTSLGGGTGCGGYGCGTVFELSKVQDFSLAVTSQTSLTVTPGQVANYAIQVSPVNGFAQEVALSCSGAPAESTCTVTPGSVTLNNGSVAANVAVVTSGNSAGMVYPAEFPAVGDQLAASLALSVLPGLVLFSGRSGKRCGQVLYGLALLGMLTLVMTWSGCGGGGMGNSGGAGTPAGTYNLTVTGTFTSGTDKLVHSTQVTLVVQ